MVCQSSQITMDSRVIAEAMVCGGREGPKITEVIARLADGGGHVWCLKLLAGKPPRLSRRSGSAPDTRLPCAPGLLQSPRQDDNPGIFAPGRCRQKSALYRRRARDRAARSPGNR